jgi:hypothetical protein
LALGWWDFSLAFAVDVLKSGCPGYNVHLYHYYCGYHARPAVKALQRETVRPNLLYYLEYGVGLSVVLDLVPPILLRFDFFVGIFGAGFRLSELAQPWIEDHYQFE